MIDVDNDSLNNDYDDNYGDIIDDNNGDINDAEDNDNNSDSNDFYPLLAKAAIACIMQLMIDDNVDIKWWRW